MSLWPLRPQLYNPIIRNKNYNHRVLGCIACCWVTVSTCVEPFPYNKYVPRHYHVYNPFSGRWTFIVFRLLWETRPPPSLGLQIWLVTARSCVHMQYTCMNKSQHALNTSRTVKHTNIQTNQACRMCCHAARLKSFLHPCNEPYNTPEKLASPLLSMPVPGRFQTP